MTNKYIAAAASILIGVISIISLFWFPLYRDTVKDWQSLIGSILTLIAAAVAVIPVWRQLERTSVQTATMHREFLIDQLQIIRKRKLWIMNFLWGYANKISNQLYEIREVLQVEVGPEWAHNWDIETSTIRLKFGEFRLERQDSDLLEQELDNLSTSLDLVWDLLDQIHRPASSSVSDDERDIPPEEAQLMLEKSELAKFEIVGSVERLRGVIRRVDMIYEEEIKVLNRKTNISEQMLISTD